MHTEKPDNATGELDRSYLLEELGRRLHVTLMWLVAVYSIIFFFINLAIGQQEQAIVTIAALPGVSVTWLLYSYGYYYYSRVWNAFQISALITLVVLYSGPDMFANAFFVPIILGILITFQGKERKTGYVLSALLLILMVVLQVFEWKIGPHQYINGSMSMIVERTINVVGSSMIIIVQSIFLIRANEAIQAKLFQQTDDLNRRNDQLKAAIFSREKMMSVLSHDLRSPLALLYSGLDVLVPGKLSAEVQERMIEQFKARMGQTLDLVDNMLLWSRIQKDAVVYNPIAVNIEQLYRFVEAYCKLLSPGKNIQIDFRFTHREGVRVMCDRDMVEAVFRNLISNAFKFTPDGGKITLASRPCSNGWCFDVIDSGRGMIREEVEMLNNGISFSRGGTNNEKGHGLGVQLVKDFLTHHGSKLEVKSVIDEGSTFSFSLPLV